MIDENFQNEQLLESTELQDQVVDNVEHQPEQQPVAESNSDRNWREMRETQYRLEKERDEALFLARQAAQEMQKYQRPQQQDLGDDEIDDDDIVDGKQLKKILQNRLGSISRKVQDYESTVLERQMRDKFDDFDSVVTHESIAALNKEYPDIAYSLSLNSNEKQKAIAAYTVIKKLGLAGSQENKSYDQDKVRAQTNAAKPRSLNSVSPQQGESPLSHANAFANGMTEELRKKLYAEMQQKARGY